MIHWKARRLLPQALDGTLAAHIEGEVRDHAAHCRSCTRALAEFETCEALLSELPTALVPLHAPAGLEDRLTALSRWVIPPQPSLGERLTMSAVGVASAAALFLIVMTGQAWSPQQQDFKNPMTLASVLPISDVQLIPTGVARWQ